MESMDHGLGESRPQLESDDILLSVAMSRLCMQSERVVKAVRESCGKPSPVVGEGGELEIFQFDTDTEDNQEEEGCDHHCDGDGGTTTNADIAMAISTDVWDRWLDVVKREIRAMQQEDERVCAWYRTPGTEDDDLAHLDNVMRKLSDVWRLRDHVLGFMDEKAAMTRNDGENGGEEVSPDWLEKATFFLMCSIGAEELEEEGLRTTRMVRAKFGDGCLPALEGWLGGQRSVAWWMRESAVLVDA